jgi:thioredoxin-dependent peroxiredoxin
MKTINLESFSGKNIVLCSIPSIDTPVCAKETKIFNEKVGHRLDSVILVVSKDLPFALKRYCAAEGVRNVVTGSAFRDTTFASDYGVELANGPLEGLCARAVFLIDKKGILQYHQLVAEIGHQPDYDQVIEQLEKL